MKKVAVLQLRPCVSTLSNPSIIWMSLPLPYTYHAEPWIDFSPPSLVSEMSSYVSIITTNDIASVHKYAVMVLSADITQT